MLKRTVLVGALVLGIGLWAFEPWRIVTDSEVNEALPSMSSRAADTGSAGEESTTRAEPGELEESQLDAATAPVVELASGPFSAAEHATDGRARVIELSDGSRFLRLEDLATSDGPDLQMWITDQPSGGSWGSYDDGRYVPLGELKANNGNQNYEIPADVDLRGMQSVVIWCDRFNVAFGSAPISL